MLKKALLFSLVAGSSLSLGMNLKNTKFKKQESSQADKFRQDMNKLKQSSCTILINSLREFSFNEGAAKNPKDAEHNGLFADSIQILTHTKCDPDFEFYNDMEPFDSAVEDLTENNLV